MCNLSDWKYKLDTANTVIFEVNADLARLTIRQINAITEMFEAMTQDGLHVIFELQGHSTIGTLPLSLLKIGWLDLAGNGWTGNSIYYTWHALRRMGSTPPVVRLHLADMSPQLYSDRRVGKKFTAMLITSHRACITSMADTRFFKVKISESAHIPRILATLTQYGRRREQFREVDIIMHDKDNLFGAVWTAVWECLEEYNYQKFAVHATDGVHERSRLAVDGTAFSAKLYGPVDVKTLPIGMESAKLYVDIGYKAREKSLHGLAKWLACRNSLRHLEIDERIGLLALAMDILHSQRKSGNNEGLAQLKTLKARLGDNSMKLVTLFELPRTCELFFIVDELHKRGHQFVQSGRDDGWDQEQCKQYGPLHYITFTRTSPTSRDSRDP